MAEHGDAGERAVYFVADILEEDADIDFRGDGGYFGLAAQVLDDGACILDAVGVLDDLWVADAGDGNRKDRHFIVRGQWCRDHATMFRIVCIIVLTVLISCAAP